MGTSVTQGAGAGKLGNTTWPGFAWQFSDWLAAAFPAANLTVHHLGEGGSTPNYWDACGYMLLPQVGQGARPCCGQWSSWQAQGCSMGGCLHPTALKLSPPAGSRAS